MTARLDHLRTTFTFSIVMSSFRITIQNSWSKKSTNMKKSTLIICLLLTAGYGMSQSSKDKEIIKDSEEAKAAFIKQDPQMAGTFNKSYGYVIFPNVGKGGLGIGGAAGNGAVY